MSEPIKNKRADLVGAPTPQNTPSTAAPISSHAVAPKVSTIAEDSEKNDAAALLASNPQLVRMIQGKLNTLVGRSSGYIESLPAPVRRRINGLKGIQKDHTKLEAAFHEEVLELEKKYFALFTPLYEKRSKVVNGQAEPTEAEIEAGAEDDDDEDQEEAKEPKTEKPEDANIKGIPEFWLTAMKNSQALSATITDRDEAALKYITNIRIAYPDKHGFQLIFEFADNEFFTNKQITKTYFYQDSGYPGDYIYDHATGDKIDWKEGKDLTVRIESKKQRNKNTKQTRVVKRTVPCESFFNFFTPPNPPTGEEEELDDEAEEISERLELDYGLGEEIKEKLIPRAVDWYTGDALQYEDIDDGLDDGDYDDEDDEERFSDEDNDDDDEESDDEDDNSKPKQEAADCKQS